MRGKLQAKSAPSRAEKKVSVKSTGKPMGVADEKKSENEKKLILSVKDEINILRCILRGRQRHRSYRHHIWFKRVSAMQKKSAQLIHALRQHRKWSQMSTDAPENPQEPPFDCDQKNECLFTSDLPQRILDFKKMVKRTGEACLDEMAARRIDTWTLVLATFAVSARLAALIPLALVASKTHDSRSVKIKNIFEKDAKLIMSHQFQQNQQKIKNDPEVSVNSNETPASFERLHSMRGMLHVREKGSADFLVDEGDHAVASFHRTTVTDKVKDGKTPMVVTAEVHNAVGSVVKTLLVFRETKVKRLQRKRRSRSLTDNDEEIAQSTSKTEVLISHLVSAHIHCC